MNYYIDTEFLEGAQKEKFPINLIRKNTPPTIDLISIGIVSEDVREYYAISKDFNLKEAWNRFDLKLHSGDRRNKGDGTYKVYWIRENVLRTIFDDLVLKHSLLEYKANQLGTTSGYNPPYKFNYKTLKKLINLFGKTNKEIAEEVLGFTGQYQDTGAFSDNKPKFYAYYADYDWVAFCWLFGKMINLPSTFPMYCRDLKQILDEKYILQENKYADKTRLEAWNEDVKRLPSYPKQENEHNALEDARWNKKLHEFLNKI